MKTKGTYLGYYITEDIGEKIIQIEIEDLKKGKILTEFKIVKNREDKDLLEVVRDINDESIVRVIQVPDDAKYGINSDISKYVEVVHII